MHTYSKSRERAVGLVAMLLTLPVVVGASVPLRYLVAALNAGIKG